jgi:DNA-directed RNA polymerase subunit M/transcription elongation factor TFIIS
MDTLTVKCPDCKNILVVDRKTGEVLEVRKPIIEDSTGDRFEDARRKVLDSQSRAEKLFQDAKQKEKGKMARLEALFNEKKDEFKDQPITRPDRPSDHD